MAVYNKEDSLPKIVKESILMKSKDMPANSQKVVGYDFNNGVDYRKLLESYAISGFQATNFGLAVEEINKMVSQQTHFPFSTSSKVPHVTFHVNFHIIAVRC